MKDEKDTYQQTVDFWDDIFENTEDSFDFEEELPIKEIENCLDWLVDEESSIIDFGCGNGKLLFRCLAKGAKKGTGVDISSRGIKKAEKFAEQNDLEKRSDLFVGAIETLYKLEDNEFDAGILSNIVDNLIPEDAIKLLDEFNRIIKPGGKTLLKLNDYVEPEEMESYNAEKIGENLYREEEGIYLWNLKDDDIEELLEKRFIIEKRIDVEFKEHDQINRLFYLKNR
ncbi:MAG: class I SAM-dependent methyltransferase [Candidatus Thermoplasmatota archaeon]|nr:class I SAM-dependent methyltransferase [Candidatus Thermoplasmatota archaeon]MBS3790225.1 class I SAM-dependent methyltransferase [Candidatus Thermoplasmatota archaeon]